MESQTLALISEIGPQHHLVVNEEGIVQFTDDGNELLVYDDLTASIVRVPSCPVSWNHFGLEVQPDNTITAHLNPIMNSPIMNSQIMNSPIMNSQIMNSPIMNTSIPNSPIMNNIDVKEEMDIKSEMVDYEIETTAATIQTVNQPKFNMFAQRLQNDALKAAWLKELQQKVKPKQTKRKRRTRKTSNSQNENDPSKNSSLFKEHFTVKKFTPEEQIIEFEKRKENRQKYLERLYKCQTCYRGFQLQENYAKHMLCHMVKTKYFCAICRLYLETKGIYHSHMNQHKQKFICKHCDFESYHRASSSLHARGHSFNLPQSYQTYMNHTSIGKRARYCCPKCGFSFVNEVGLKLHERRTHRDDPGIPENGPECSMCGVIFASEQAFIMHCRIMHSEYVTVKSALDEYTQLPPSPSMETTVTLQSAEYSDTVTAGVLQNDGRDDGRLYNQTVTNQTENNFRLHMNNHEDDDNQESSATESIMGDDEEKDLMCEICQRMFTDPIVLYRHVHSHKYAIRLKQQSRRPECPQCGMTFSTFSNRLRHIKYAHTEIRPSICDICHKGFKSEPELRSHVDHVHLKKPWPKRNRGRGGRETSPY